jgi:hypothetical protein
MTLKFSNQNRSHVDRGASWQLGTKWLGGCLLVLVACAGFVGSSSAHHAQAPFFDQNSDVQIDGTVQRFDFRNPHPMLYVEALNAKGERVVWSIQFASVQILIRAGITAAAFTAGERITALGHPSWDREARGMQGAKITTADGREFIDPLRSTKK